MSLGYKSLGTLVVAGSLIAGLPAWGNDKAGPKTPKTEQQMQATYSGDESTVQKPEPQDQMTPSEDMQRPPIRVQDHKE